MATSTVASLPRLCRKGVERFVRHSPGRTLPLPLDQTVAEILAIAEYNFRSGRFDYLKYHRLTQPKLTPTRYTQLLIEHWATEYPRVQRLNDCDSAELE